jgi:hypothetical protein
MEIRVEVFDDLRRGVGTVDTKLRLGTPADLQPRWTCAPSKSPHPRIFSTNIGENVTALWLYVVEI